MILVLTIFYSSGEGILPISFLQKQKSESVEREQIKDRIVFRKRPELEKGINYIEKDKEVSAFQVFLDSELGGVTGKAVWIDCLNEASTYSLSALGSPDLLERVKIGRAFTVFQHHSLIDRLEEFMDEETKIIVLSNFEHLYVNGQVNEWEAKELFKESWSKIKELSNKNNVKILVSCSNSSEFSQKVQKDSNNFIDIERTEEGLKYSSSDHKQIIYSDGNNTQTTMSYWIQKNRRKSELKKKV